MKVLVIGGGGREHAVDRCDVDMVGVNEVGLTPAKLHDGCCGGGTRCRWL
jgi:hypothetical protein